MSRLISRVPKASVTVSTPAPLLDWTDLSGFNEFSAWLTNKGASVITLTVTGSLDGVTPDASFAWSVDIAAGEHGSLPLPAPPQQHLAHRFWRVDAHSASPGYASTAADWGLDGTLRDRSAA